MARLSSRALRSSLLLLPVAGLVFAACGTSTQSTPDTGIGGFGDGGTPKPDATMKKDTGAPKHDTGTPGVDATADVREASVGITDGAVGTLCTTSMECASGVCAPMSLMGTVDGALHLEAGDCAMPGANCECFSGTCTDGVKNGRETDVDCGGGSCPACPVGDKCLLGSDCSQGECGAGYAGGKCTGLSPDAGPTDAASPADAGACVCEPPSCGDGVKNEDETDIDCGGSVCSKCPTGKACKVTGDCTSDVCTANTCACPAGMTEAPTSSSVPYCIDTYEVTYAQYSVFVGSANTTTIANQPAECQWNTSFVPSNNWPQVGNEAKNPVNNVNWCDALAYCASVQHHLCGAIKTTMSPGGTPIPLASTAIFQDASILAANDPSVDEWYNACSSQGQNTYPYSNTYQATWCNGVDSPAQRTSGPVEIPIGTQGSVVDTGAPSCILDTGCSGQDQAGILSTVAQGATVTCKVLANTPGATAACGNAFTETGCIGGSSVNIVYDLSGNVAEWENSCDGTSGASDNCAVRGGSYDSSPGMTSLTCASSAAQPPLARNTQAPDVGFRCCL